MELESWFTLGRGNLKYVIEAYVGDLINNDKVNDNQIIIGLQQSVALVPHIGKDKT